MIQRTTRDYEVSLWSLQDSFIAILKQYGLEFKGQIENGKLADRDDGTQTFSFDIPMYYIKDGKKIPNPGWYNVQSGSLLVNMRKIKVIFNKDNANRKIYQFLIIKVDEKHNDDNSLYCSIECEGLAFHELGKIGYKISLSDQDFYNDDYDWATTGKWNNVAKSQPDTTQPLATLNYWNDKVFNTIDNWTYEVHMDWGSHSLEKLQKQGVTEDYTIQNDVISYMSQRNSNKVYEQDFIDSWDLKNNQLVPAHITYAREKARVSIDLHDSNIYNITQSLAETFGVFCKYIYQYDQNCHIIGRKVVYYNNFLNQKDGIIDISYPYQTNFIQRNIDSTDLVTKLYVKSIENENGMLSIIDVGANRSQEDYLLNFDYLYKIGGITEQQYQAVEKYIVQIRDLNETIAPISAKVISLQSQLTKLQAELTIRKNAIGLDTEQLLANSALLNSITNGTEILSVTESNPQTAILLEDTAQHRITNYYVKITQKGVYPQTIRLYKNYSYSTSKLTNQILTGVVNFDDSGQVIRVSNIYADANDSKTVYITYDYRPALFYERIVKMWENRLHEDTVNKEKLQQEVTLLNYSLYGEDSQYSLDGKNIANLAQFNVYNRYLNLLQQKQKLIKEFNAMMGPALREGYWQPEDYNDYGDRYNDKFLIQLNNTEQKEGSTKNSYFAWDDEAFQGEQELYYQYSAAQYQQAYPCIDLSTKKGQEILRMMAENPDQPISFVFKPLTSEESDERPRHSPSFIDEGDNQLILIPNLYVWANDEGSEVKLNDNIKERIELKNNTEELINYLESNNPYNGKLNAIMKQGWKKGYTSFYWQLKKKNIDDQENLNTDQNQQLEILFESNSTSELMAQNFQNNCRVLTQENSYPYQIRLLSNNTENFIDTYDSITLFAQNYKTPEDQHPHITYNIRGLQHNTIQSEGNLTQLQLKDDLESQFTAAYRVNGSSLDMMLNYYTWSIDIQGQKCYINYTEHDKSNSAGESDFTLAGELEFTINGTIIKIPYEVNKKIEQDYTQHTLILKNKLPSNRLAFNQLASNTQIQVNFNIKNPNDFINDGPGIFSKPFRFYANMGEPQVITQRDDRDVLSIELGTRNDFNLFISAHLIDETNNYTNGLKVIWQYNDNGNWVDIFSQNSIFNSTSNLFTIEESEIQINDNIVSYTLQITINENLTPTQKDEISTFINGKQIRASIENNKNNSNNPTIFKIYTPLLITNPIIFNSDDIQELVSPEIILLEPPETPESTYINKTITIKAQNATSYEWHIIPSGTNQQILLNVDMQTTSSINGYYQVSLSEDVNTNKIISQLIIQIPTIGQNNALRDNHTKIRCICTNSSGQLANKYLPVKNNDEITWTTLQVSYPILINNNILETTKQWWAIDNKSYNIGSIFFSIPIAMIKNSAQNSINDFSIIASINKILYQTAEEIISNQNFRVTLSNITEDNNLSDSQFITYTTNISFLCTDVNSITYDNQSIVLSPSTNNDEQYELNLNIIITYNYDTGITPTAQINIPILVRQNIPEINDNITINDGDYIQYSYTTTNSNNQPNIILNAYTDNTFSIKPHSTSSIQWENANDLAAFSDELGDNPTLYNAKWSIPENQQQITINKENTSVKTTVVTPGLNYVKLGDYGYVLGYNKELYLTATNPWGTLTSKRFQFQQENNSN